MTNKELFDIANKKDDSILKEALRNRFNEWCIENSRTNFNPQSIIDWWEEEVLEKE